MIRKEAKRIVNDLVDKTYCGKPASKRWDIQFGRNPWFSLGIHIDHKDPSMTLHLPGALIYLGNCKQPGFRFWNNIVPEVIQKAIVDTKVLKHDQKDSRILSFAALDFLRSNAVRISEKSDYVKNIIGSCGVPGISPPLYKYILNDNSIAEEYVQTEVYSFVITYYIGLRHGDTVFEFVD